MYNLWMVSTRYDFQGEKILKDHNMMFSCDVCGCSVDDPIEMKDHMFYRHTTWTPKEKSN
jgi:hypothetical protein